MSEDVKKIGNTIADVAVQGSTFGLLGYEDGKLGTGVSGDLIVDTTKEITGANAAEEANRIARQQFEEDRARLAQQRADSLAADEQEQIRRSRGAGRARGGVGASNSDRLNTASQDMDFLGL